MNKNAWSRIADTIQEEGRDRAVFFLAEASTGALTEPERRELLRAAGAVLPVWVKGRDVHDQQSLVRAIRDTLSWKDKRQALRGLTGLLGGNDIKDIVEGVVRVAATVGPEVASSLGDMGGTIGVVAKVVLSIRKWRSAEAPSSDPALLLKRALASASQKTTMLVVVEEAHDALNRDLVSRSIFDDLIQRPGQAPRAIVVLLWSPQRGREFRADFVDRFKGPSHVNVLRLGTGDAAADVNLLRQLDSQAKRVVQAVALVGSAELRVVAHVAHVSDDDVAAIVAAQLEPWVEARGLNLSMTERLNRASREVELTSSLERDVMQKRVQELQAKGALSSEQQVVAADRQQAVASDALDAGRLDDWTIQLVYAALLRAQSVGDADPFLQAIHGRSLMRDAGAGAASTLSQVQRARLDVVSGLGDVLRQRFDVAVPRLRQAHAALVQAPDPAGAFASYTALVMALRTSGDHRAARALVHETLEAVANRADAVQALAAETWLPDTTQVRAVLDRHHIALERTAVAVRAFRAELPVMCEEVIDEVLVDSLDRYQALLVEARKHGLEVEARAALREVVGTFDERITMGEDGKESALLEEEGAERRLADLVTTLGDAVAGEDPDALAHWRMRTSLRARFVLVSSYQFGPEDEMPAAFAAAQLKQGVAQYRDDDTIQDLARLVDDRVDLPGRFREVERELAAWAFADREQMGLAVTRACTLAQVADLTGDAEACGYVESIAAQVEPRLAALAVPHALAIVELVCGCIPDQMRKLNRAWEAKWEAHLDAEVEEDRTSDEQAARASLATALQGFGGGGHHDPSIEGAVAALQRYEDAWLSDDNAAALEALRVATGLLRPMDDLWFGIGDDLLEKVAHVHAALDEPEAARQALLEALSLADRTNQHARALQLLEQLGDVERERDNWPTWWGTARARLDRAIERGDAAGFGVAISDTASWVDEDHGIVVAVEGKPPSDPRTWLLQALAANRGSILEMGVLPHALDEWVTELMGMKAEHTPDGLGDTRVSEARASEETRAALARLTGLAPRVVSRRVDKLHGRTLLRNAFPELKGGGADAAPPTPDRALDEEPESESVAPRGGTVQPVMSHEAIGLLRAAQVDDDVAEIVAGLCGFKGTKGVRRRTNKDPDALVRDLFAELWESPAVLGALTATKAKELDLAPVLGRLAGIPEADVRARLNNVKHGKTLVRNVVPLDVDEG